MLSYSVEELQKQCYRNVATEEFEDVTELCAEILILGVSSQLRRGLGRSYVTRSDALSSPRGKIKISDSIKQQSMIRQRLVCDFDDFSVDYYLNQIVKSTMELLLKSKISRERKLRIRKLLVYFGEVKSLDLHTVQWNQRYDRNNQSYQLLVSTCYQIVHELLQTQSEGANRLMDFSVERMPALYQNFVTKYYQKRFPKLKPKARQIKWQLDQGSEEGLLPKMVSDITLTYQGKTLIIDTKYYDKALQTNQFGNQTNRSANLYQIFTYVKNKEYELWLENENRRQQGEPEQSYQVSGMLLYAMTDEKQKPDKIYQMSGNQISVKSLDLNQEFDKIKKQLDDIVINYFGEEL